MRKAPIALAIAALAVSLIPIACRADAPSYDDAGAEEVLAAAEAAMAEVDSFAHAMEFSYGTGDRQGWDTIQIASEFQDAQNYRKRMSVRIPGTPSPGPSDFALVDGESYLSEPEGAIRNNLLTAPPTYNPPHDMAGIERVDDEMLDGVRVYRLRGTWQPGAGLAPITVDLFIDTETLLLLRLDSRSITYVASADLAIESLSTSVFSRFNEDFDIVPPDPAPTPTPDPTPTPR